MDGEKDLLREEGQSYDTCIERSRRCAAEARLTEARKHAHRAASIDPSRPEAFNLLGACSEACGNPLDAQKYYRAALALDPSFAPAQKNLHRLIVKGYGPVDLG